MRPAGNPPSRSPSQDGPRVNDKIKALEVRLIGDDGSQLGVVSTRDALLKAEEVGLDLVEVSPDARPPVCKILDYGKYKYQQSKKAQEAKRKQVVVEVKEIALTPNTDTHDMETKRNHIKRWILEKNRVRVGVKFRGREMAHIELGYKALSELLAGLEDVCSQEGHPKMEGRRLMANLVPRTDK